MNSEIKKFTWNYLDSNMYVLEHKNNFLVIDPIDSTEALNGFKNAETITVLLSHEHFDHISGLNKLRKLEKCETVVIANEECSNRIQDPKRNMSLYADVLMALAEKPVTEILKPFVCTKADITFNDSYSFDWFGLKVSLVSTPGHSPGSICIGVNNLLFSGDTLLENRFMNRFPGGNTKVFKKKTVPVLKQLLEKVDYVYPGHGMVISRETALQILDNNVL